jgi:hypothetical protein
MFSRIQCVSLVMVLCVVACSGSDEISLVPTPKVQEHLDAHVAAIFDAVSAENPEQFDADQERVRRVHQIAWLAEQYYKETGSYPLADGTLKNIMIGNPNTRVPKDNEHYVHEDTLLAELQYHLGYDLTLPQEPLQDSKGYYGFTFSVYGSGYTVAAMCYHPVGWSEGIMPGQWQYRVGSYENPQLPVMEAAKLFAGKYPNNRKARPRDPSMVNQ